MSWLASKLMTREFVIHFPPEATWHSGSLLSRNSTIHLSQTLENPGMRTGRVRRGDKDRPSGRGQQSSLKSHKSRCSEKGVDPSRSTTARAAFALERSRLLVSYIGNRRNNTAVRTRAPISRPLRYLEGRS